MLDFEIIRENGQKKILTSMSGKALLTVPQLNKGTAFTKEERHAFGLLGKLPHRVETLEEQVKRAYLQYLSYSTQLQQNIYLNNLHDKNQVLFYKLLSQYLKDMLPTIYTPIVGMAVKRFSHEYRQPRGLYIAHSDINDLDEIFSNRSNPSIEVIVVTDGEGVLGIGDQGIGGMDIPVAKLMVYSLCGGIDPTKTLPIFLDVGTNNDELLADPLYLGCRHQRIADKDYDHFISTFIIAVQKHFPHAFLHWEDLGRRNAKHILDTYTHQMCTFNDDIQGTGVVTLAALLSACEQAKQPLSSHKIIIFGAGSAGTGIADHLVEALVRQGASLEEAYSHFWLVDRQGLLIENDLSLTPAQKPYARDSLAYPTPLVNLIDVVRLVKPTILIGCSAQSGAFNQEIVTLMCQETVHPIIFPLSNPDERCEAHPADLLAWSHGKALIATGTAFNQVSYQQAIIPIAQCNNALVFPGIGLGVSVTKASRLSKDMIWAATQALSELAINAWSTTHSLLPSLAEAQKVAQTIALAVAKAAAEEGLAETENIENIAQTIDNAFWHPQYLPFERKNKSL